MQLHKIPFAWAESIQKSTVQFICKIYKTKFYEKYKKKIQCQKQSLKKICKAKMIEMLFSFVQNESKPTKSVITQAYYKQFSWYCFSCTITKFVWKRSKAIRCSKFYVKFPRSKFTLHRNLIASSETGRRWPIQRTYNYEL